MPSLNTKLASAPNTTSNYVLKATSSTTIGNSLIFDNGTNVGIGTTTLTGKLTISTPNTTSTAAISLRSASLPTYGIDIDQEDVSYGYMAMYSVRANVRTLGLVQSWGASTNGYVGIGTSSPTQILDVFGPRVRMGDGGGFELNFNTTTFAAFQLNGTERMRITSTGNVGIGTSSPAGAYMLTLNGNTTTNLGGINLRQNGTDTFYLGNPSVGNTTDFELWNPRDGYTRFATNNTERMRITSGGFVQINTTAGGATLNLKAQPGNNIIRLQNVSNGDGSIYAYGTSTTFNYAFNTYSVADAFYLYNSGNYDFAGSDVSDRRLKENIETISYNATEKLMQLVPKSYNMIKHPDTKRNGFIAQEVQEILPDLITGTESEDDYLGLDYNGLLAIAVKSIQELNQKVEAQQQQINQLINK